MNSNGIIAVVSGFAGTGKGTVMKKLVEEYDHYALSISMTTRTPRPGEVDGREYFFTDEESFTKAVKEDKLIEHACYCGKYYGTPREYVDKQLQNGKDVLLEIDIQGALQIKQRFPDSYLIFIMPPSSEELVRRLKGRGTETDEQIKNRLKRAGEESEGIEKYDAIVVNEDIAECASDINRLIEASRFRPSHNEDFIRSVREGIRSL
ncbi:MAG: guanylate kinase [Lachnospiraceae bacterium]|nr:guanylate kinase [Lachnospiraceae bacterium]